MDHQENRSAFGEGRRHYRPDIDGLRALAVLLVVAFHVAPNSIRGGYVGVDAFFVISGYLITALILRDIDTDRFSYTTFYARRVRRIFPALFALLIGVLLAGVALLLPGEMRHLGTQVVSSSLFYSNVQFWTESGYFEPAANSNTLLHIWSLGVEEQFYFFWPSLVVFAVVARRYTVAMWLAFGGSLLLAIRVGSFAPSTAFYLTPMRLWEFVAGAIVVWVTESAKIKRLWMRLSQRTRTGLANGFAVIGFTFVIATGLALVELQEPLNRLPVLSVLGTALIIGAGPGAIVNRLLSTRPSVFIGRISYSLYLWHWPLLSFLFITSAGRPEPMARLAAVGLAMGLAVLSWRIVETPIRERRILRSVTDPGWCVIGIATAVVFAIVGAVYASGLAKPIARIGAAQEAVLEPLVDGYGPNYVQTFKTVTHPACVLVPASANAPRCPSSPRRSSIVLWGDSHAEHLYPGLAANLPAGTTLLPALTGCAPVLGKFDYQSNECARSSDATLRALTERRPETVVMAGRWKNVVGDPQFLQKLDATVRVLRRAQVERIVIVGPVPEWSPDLYLIVARRYVRLGAAVPERLRDGYLDEPQRIDHRMAEHFAGSGVDYVSIENGLCTTDEGCLIRVGGDLSRDLIAWDYGHFTAKGSTYVVSHIIGPHLDLSGPLTAERRIEPSLPEARRDRRGS